MEWLLALMGCIVLFIGGLDFAMCIAAGRADEQMTRIVKRIKKGEL